MGLLSWKSDDLMDAGCDAQEILKFRIKLSGLRVYKKFFRKVMDKNPAYHTRREFTDDYIKVTFDATSDAAERIGGL
jgi:hypothetical protein